MLLGGPAPGSAPGMLPGGGRAVPRILRVFPRRSGCAGPLGASAAADPDKAPAFDPTVTSRFFNRGPELEVLNSFWDSNPNGIQILTGPQDSGKTALVRHIMGWRAARQAADAEGPPPVLYLDCRAKDMSTPVELAKHLRELVTKNKAIEDAVNKLLGVLKGTASMGGVTFSATLKDMFDERRDVTPMASVIASYTELLELFKARRYKPIIVIDEANVLQAWREADAGAPELDKLLRFFVKITKQDNAAHVVLATSSSFLESWLRKKGLGSRQLVIDVVGDLPEAEARRYFCGGGDWPGLIMESAAVPPGGREAWPKVYAACGGNIGLLRRCVVQAKPWRDWDKAVRAVVEEPAAAVADGLDPATMPTATGHPAPMWTSDQFRTALRLVARAPHHAVLAGKVKAALGPHGSQVLLSLVAHNLLALRPWSDLARDLPREAWEGERGGRVVTMPSPAELLCVLEMDAAGKLGEGETAGGA